MSDRLYYTLVSIPHKGSTEPWAVQFGDYARDVVRAEMADYKEGDRNTNKPGQRPVYRILTHTMRTQKLCVAGLNRIEGRA